MHFVFLQGMPSPFFTRIGERLANRGCTVSAINLCFGDWYFWRGPNALNYRGRLAGWGEYLARYFIERQVTDIVLLGEQRLYHRIAVAVAKRHNVRVTVTDFGYLRSDWITLERDGMSGNSTFPKDIADILALAKDVPAVDAATKYTDSFWTMARGDLIYSFGNVFLGYLYPFYRQSVKRAHPLLYFPAMALRLSGEKRRHGRAMAQIARLIGQKSPYFVFPLQLEHDFQIIAYSPFTGLDEPIRLVLRSFALHAEPTARLVIKPHPWDPGLRRWPKLIQRLATGLGIAERIDYIDGGTLDEVAAGSLGMVTINSTSGLRALQLGLPVKVLGQAVYDRAGLTFQDSLDHFWRDAKAPDAQNVDAFVKALAATTQLRGVFFNEPGLTAAVEAASERLLSQTVGAVLDGR